MKKTNVAIIIAAHKRPKSLNRILSSLDNAFYPADCNPELIISIDHSGSDDCYDIAKNFHWNNGKKTIIHHKHNLGLKKHILKCGDLSFNYDFIILLEDDLFVSQYFFDYALKVYDFYQNEEQLAGFSLYSYSFNETALKPFIPVPDGTDIFFIQLPSSWGQIWTKNQWSKFTSWLKNEYFSEIINNYIVPDNIINWPERSWKKLFVFYMIINKLYFVYPKISLTTNFMDQGANHTLQDNYLQVPLLSENIKYNLITYNSTLYHYDSFCELSDKAFKKQCKSLEDFQFEVDLYGTKPLNKIEHHYILTSKKSLNPLFQFSLALKPHELNIFYQNKGNALNFSRIATIIKDQYSLADSKRNCYYYNIPYFLANKTKEIKTEAIRTADPFGNDYEDQLHEIKNSLSWRITEPLRKILDLILLLKDKLIT